MLAIEPENNAVNCYQMPLKLRIILRHLLFFYKGKPLPEDFHYPEKNINVFFTLYYIVSEDIYENFVLELCFGNNKNSNSMENSHKRH